MGRGRGAGLAPHRAINRNRIDFFVIRKFLARNREFSGGSERRCRSRPQAADSQDGGFQSDALLGLAYYLSHLSAPIGEGEDGKIRPAPIRPITLPQPEVRLAIPRFGRHLHIPPEMVRADQIRSAPIRD